MPRVFAALGFAIVAGCSGGSSSDGAAGDVGLDAGVDAFTDDAWQHAPPVDPTSLFHGLAPFKDVATSSGLPDVAGTCVVFDDFDGDARPDVFLASFLGAPQSVGLYLNDGAGHFTSKPVPVVFDSKVPAPGWCAAGDLDADGKLDVVLGSFASIEAHVLRNIGGGAFSDVQTLTSEGGALGYAAIALADLDSDGWLDVVVAPIGNAPTLGPTSCAPTLEGFACVDATPRCMSPPLFFRNTGKATVQFAAGVTIASASDCGPANANALSITDWNDDGRPDVFVSNDWGTNRLYLNRGGGKFDDVLPSLGTKTYNSAMGAAFEDFDFDGNADLYVADMGSDQLYLGVKGGPLAAHATDWGVAQPTRFHSGWAPLAEDFDSDGFLDVFVANAAFVTSFDDLALVGGRGLAPRLKQYDFLLHGEAGHGFTALGIAQSKVADAAPMFGATAVADLDADGRLDILEAIGYPMRLQLLHNEGDVRHWLRVRLRGHTPNVDGIGATVTVSVPGRPAWKRYVSRSRGSNGSSWATVHFGLGAATKVDRVEVRWPDGTTQTVDAPAIDATLAVTQP